MSGYVEVASEAFAFLETGYHFSIKDCSDENGGGHMTYVNVEVGVGVKALYEFSSAFVFVFIYRLVNGQLRDNVLPITDESEITCFDFNDALAADQKMKPAYEYGDDSEYFDEQNGLLNYVMEFATRLKRYGGEFLVGNFAAVLSVEEAIKRRARELNQEIRRFQ